MKNSLIVLLFFILNLIGYSQKNVKIVSEAYPKLFDGNLKTFEVLKEDRHKFKFYNQGSLECFIDSIIIYVDDSEIINDLVEISLINTYVTVLEDGDETSIVRHTFYKKGVQKITFEKNKIIIPIRTGVEILDGDDSGIISFVWNSKKERKFYEIDLKIKNCTTYEEADEKPVIYLYPETPTNVRINCSASNKFTFTYPVYHNGWRVKAYPDGTLLDEQNKKYPYLFWEGLSGLKIDWNEGFCVPRR